MSAVAPKNLFEHRILFISNEIETESCNLIISQLLLLNAESHEPIDLYINSPGGSVLAGLAIIDAMNCIRAPVHTVCIGQASSIAALILASGELGHRASTPNAEIMLHEVLGGYSGKSLNIKVHAERMCRLQNQVLEQFSRRTQRNIDLLKDDINNDYFLTAEEALKYGLIDHVLMPFTNI